MCFLFDLSCQDKDVRLSKSMSYVLRHGANQMGLQIGSGEENAFKYCRLITFLTLPSINHTHTLDGFLFVDELLAHPQFHSYTLEDVERVVNTNDKQRFKLRSHPENGCLQVRASQGHSIKVRLCQGFLRVVPDLEVPEYNPLILNFVLIFALTVFPEAFGIIIIICSQFFDRCIYN